MCDYFCHGLPKLSVIKAVLLLSDEVPWDRVSPNCCVTGGSGGVIDKSVSEKTYQFTDYHPDPNHTFPLKNSNILNSYQHPGLMCNLSKHSRKHSSKNVFFSFVLWHTQ